MSDRIVNDWLERFVGSALAYDLGSHMAMISPEVLVFGVPGFDSLDYDDWYRQCECEFPQGLVTGLRYDNVRIRTSSDEDILFKSLETTQTSRGGCVEQAVEILLHNDGDTWRLKQMRLLEEDEARHDGLT